MYSGNCCYCNFRVVSTEIHLWLKTQRLPSEASYYFRMETDLNKEIEETMSQPGVVGVICTDSQGLCLGADGTASPNSAGVITAITQQASQLSPDQSTAPVICLESDKGNVLIKSHNDVNVAIHKMPVF